MLSGTPSIAGTYSFTAQVTDKTGASASASLQVIITATALAITTASPLLAGKVNTSYTQSFEAGGGTPPYANWSISSGALPPGLAFNTAGVLTGTPTNAGSYMFTVQVTDKAGATASTPFQVTINAATLAITTTSPLLAGKVNTSYTQSFVASGGVPPYTNWTTSNGSLPSGLTLNSAGVLSGTPVNAGNYGFTVQVSDSSGASASAPFQLTITSSGLAIATPSPLQSGHINSAYAQNLTASGGTPPYAHWTISNGALPAGLTLSSTGVISGTPTTSGIFGFSVQVTDSAGATASAQFQLTIASGTLAITTASPLPAGKVNTAYSLSFGASGGNSPYAWTVNGTVPGLTISSTGLWSGTPATAGMYNFAVQVTDSSGASASASFQLTISPAVLAISTPSPLPAGKVNTAYSSNLSAAGGTAPYTWSINGAVPGLSFGATGVWNGTPTTAGTYTFTVQVTDSSGASASASLQLTISPSVLAISTPSPLPAGNVNIAYSSNLSATGGTAPYTWSINGAVPGLSFNSTGVWSGTPATAGTYTFTVQVTDSSGSSASASLQLTISPSALTIGTPSPLPAGKVNIAYSSNLSAAGGTAPYTWSINGAVPGLSFSSTGVWSGTPATAGTYTFTVQVTDSSGSSASASLQLTISPSALVITTASTLPTGNMQSTYSQPLAASGGTAPYTWSVNASVPGLNFNPAGLWSGTPTAVGTYSFTVQVTDSSGASASASFSLTINQPLPSLVAAVNSANFVGGLPVTTGSWVAIYGTNLAPSGDSRTWNSSTEIVNGKFPTSLDGTSVTVNGKPAAVEYVSPGQVNIQMPDDTAIGLVPVVVTTATGGASNLLMVTYAQFSPGFFPATAPYIVAQHVDNSYVTASAPALPGEVIVLWAGGMGPASPSVPAGQVLLGANPLANTVTLTIGGQLAVLDFAGIVGAGLVQVNAHVPIGIGSGDQPVVATVGGVSSPSGTYISIGKPFAASSQLRAPDSIPSTFIGRTDPNPRTVASAGIPTTPIYAGTDKGVYKSTDAGGNWQLSLASAGALTVHSIVVDPLHPSRIYAAGVNYFGGDTFFESLDGGQTWSSASAPPAMGLAIDGKSTNVIYLLGFSGGEIYRSDDSGRTWSGPLLTNVVAVATDPEVTGLVYASVSAGEPPLLKSHDFGVNWTPVAKSTIAIGEVSALVIDPYDSDTIYLAVSPAGVLRSTDCGNSWFNLGLADVLNAVGPSPPFVEYSSTGADGKSTTAIATIFTDPGNSNNLFALPRFVSEASGSNGLFRSTDGGATWSFSEVIPGGGHIFSLGLPSK